MVIKKLGITKFLAISLLSSTCSFAAVQGDFWEQANAEQLSSLVFQQIELVLKAASPEDKDKLTRETSSYFDAALSTDNPEEKKVIFYELSDYLDSFYKNVMDQKLDKNFGSMLLSADAKKAVISSELQDIHRILQSQIENALRGTASAPASDEAEATTTTASAPASDEAEVPDFSAPPYVEVEKFDDVFHERNYQSKSSMALLFGQPILSREEYYNKEMAPLISQSLKREHEAAQEKLIRDREIKEKFAAQQAKRAAIEALNRLWNGKLGRPEVKAALAYFKLDSETAEFPLLARDYRKMALTLAPDKLGRRLGRNPTAEEMDEATQTFQTFQGHYQVLKDAWEKKY